MSTNAARRGPRADGSPRNDTTERRAATLKIKRLTLDIPEELHRAIKLDAVHDGVAMVDKLRALLLQHYGLAVSPGQKAVPSQRAHDKSIARKR